MDPRTKEVIYRALSKEHTCYVLITCDPPNEDGHMTVQLSYEGDATLASFMVRGAQDILDEHQDESDEESGPIAPLRLIE